MKITWLFLIKAIAKFKWGWYERIGPSKLYCHILRIKSRAIKFKERVGWVTESDVRLGPWFLNKIPIWLKSFSYILELYLSHSSDAKRDGITSRDPINLGAKFKTQKAGRDFFNSFMLVLCKIFTKSIEQCLSNLKKASWIRVISNSIRPSTAVETRPFLRFTQCLICRANRSHFHNL